MAEQLRFTIPKPPYSQLIRRSFQEESFVKDVAALAKLTDSERVQVSEILGAATFANFQTLSDAVCEVGVENYKHVANMLFRLSAMHRDSSLEKEEVLKAFSSAISASKIDPEDQKLILKAFEELCLMPEALDLQRKAEWLAEATGAAIGDIDIVCDIRPVFDASAESIVGAIPYFTLRVEFEDGESKKIDLHLSNENLDRLKSLVDRALSKRESMIQTIQSIPSWSIPNTY